MSTSGTYLSTDILTLRARRDSLEAVSALRHASGLELVTYKDHGKDVTVQLALHGLLAVPMTVQREVFWGYEEKQQHEWLERCARTLLDIYGDARDGRVLSDHEVQRRAAA